MFVANQITGDFIVLANRNNISRYDSISESFNNLIDLARIRVKEKTIEEVANSLLEPLFNLRGQLYRQEGRKKFINLFQEGVTKELANKIQLSAYSELADTVSKVLMAYGDIAMPIFSSLKKYEEGTNTSTTNIKYSVLKDISAFPLPTFKYFKKWADAFLQFEAGLIIADLVQTGRIRIPKRRIKTELIEFLYDSITRFGAYAILLKIWKPNEEDMPNLTNRMRILSTAIQFNNGEGTRHEMNMEELRNSL